MSAEDFTCTGAEPRLRDQILRHNLFVRRRQGGDRSCEDAHLTSVHRLCEGMAPWGLNSPSFACHAHYKLKEAPTSMTGESLNCSRSW